MSVLMTIFLVGPNLKCFTVSKFDIGIGGVIDGLIEVILLIKIIALKIDDVHIMFRDIFIV